MKFIINADDYGLSKGITDNISDGFDNGILSSTSIVPNGYAFEYAISEYKKRTGLRLSVHLNFREGKPVNSPDKVSMLVNEKGEFYHTFLSLWLRYLSSGQRDRQTLKAQVKLEISAQIHKTIERLGDHFEINIDSHQHFHLIPFVFNALIELSDKYQYSYIRIPEEPFFYCIDGMRSFGNYFSSNIIKFILLNSLSRRCKTVLDDMHIQYCDYFLGVLFTGRMSEAVIRSALSIMPVTDDNFTTEILFHPGRALKEEETYWKNNKALRDYYCSPQRQYEYETVMSPSMKFLLKKD